MSDTPLRQLSNEVIRYFLSHLASLTALHPLAALRAAVATLSATSPRPQRGAFVTVTASALLAANMGRFCER